MSKFTIVRNPLATFATVLLLTSGLTACGSGSGGGNTPIAGSQPKENSPQNSPEATPESIDEPTNQPIVDVDLSVFKLEDLVDIIGAEVPSRTFDRVDWTSRCIEFDEILCQLYDFHVRFGYGDTQAIFGGNLPLETGIVFSAAYEDLQPHQKCLSVLTSKTGDIIQAEKIEGVVMAEADGTLRTHIYKLFDAEIGQQIENYGVEGYATALLCVDPNSVNRELIKVSETYFAYIGGELAPWQRYHSDLITVTPRNTGDLGSVIGFDTQICGLPEGLSLSARNFKYNTSTSEWIPQGESALTVTITSDDAGDMCASFRVFGGERVGGNAVVYSQEDGIQYIKTF